MTYMHALVQRNDIHLHVLLCLTLPGSSQRRLECLHIHILDEKFA